MATGDKVLVSNFGDDEINGIYVYSKDLNGYPMYKKNGNIYIIFTASWMPYSDSPSYYIIRVYFVDNSVPIIKPEYRKDGYNLFDASILWVSLLDQRSGENDVGTVEVYFETSSSFSSYSSSSYSSSSSSSFSSSSNSSSSFGYSSSNSSSSSSAVTEGFTKLLLHFDGNGSSVVDSSYYSRSMSGGGGFEQVLPEYYPPENLPHPNPGFGKYGYFPKGCDTGFVTVNDHLEGLGLGSGPFVIDFWCAIGNTAEDHEDVVQIEFVSTFNYSFSFSNYGKGGPTEFFCYYPGGMFYGESAETGSGFGLHYFSHVAIVRDTINTLRIFMDGLIWRSPTSVGVRTDYNANFPDPTSLSIKSNNPIGISWRTIDEFRISVGTDRGWTSDFIPPDAPYPPD